MEVSMAFEPQLEEATFQAKDGEEAEAMQDELWALGVANGNESSVG